LAQQEISPELILCINEASSLVVDSEEEGNAFFEDQGKPARGIKNILNSLTEVEASRTVTQVTVSVLAEEEVDRSSIKFYRVL